MTNRTRQEDAETRRRSNGAKGIAALFAALLLLSFAPAKLSDWTTGFAQSPSRPVAQSLIKAVNSVGFTVSDADHSVEFFSKVLSFEKVSHVEVTGDEY